MCLFQISAALDASCWRQLSKWHVYHLLNSGMTWPFWSFFAEEFQSAEEGDARRGYLAVLADGVFRATMSEKVKTIVPPVLHQFIPVISTPRCVFFTSVAIENSDGSNNELHSMPSAEMKTVAAEMKTRVSQRESPDDLSEWLSSIADEGEFSQLVRYLKVISLHTLKFGDEKCLRTNSSKASILLPTKPNLIYYNCLFLFS